MSRSKTIRRTLALLFSLVVNILMFLFISQASMLKQKPQRQPVTAPILLTQILETQAPTIPPVPPPPAETEPVRETPELPETPEFELPETPPEPVETTLETPPLPEFRINPQLAEMDRLPPPPKPVARLKPKPKPAVKPRPARKPKPNKSPPPKEIAKVTPPPQPAPPVAKATVPAPPVRRRPAQFNVGNVDQPPRVIEQVEPNYPYRARRRRITGEVLVKFRVGIDGRVEDPTILEAKPEGTFEESVLEALRRWRFSPGRYEGDPVPTWMVLPIQFNLKS